MPQLGMHDPEGGGVMADELTPHERAMIEAMRAAQNTREPDLPQYAPEDLKVRMILHAGVAGNTAAEYLKKLDHMTRTYPGPRVILTSTLGRLKASWASHLEDLVRKGKSGIVVFNHRRALNAYLRAIEADHTITSGAYERRSRRAHERRNDAGERLPDDWVSHMASIVNDVHYHHDPALQALFQHRARLGLFTAPRFPSEDTRILIEHVHMPKGDEDGSVVYMTSKTSGPEGELVLIPREVFGLQPTVLTDPTRKSVLHWLTYWRPKMEAAARHRGLGVGQHVWITQSGQPPNPEQFRQDFAAAAKTAWPGFYGYMLRELGIIIKALELTQERGHIDVEILSQWSGHESYDNLRGYMRKARAVLRSYKPGRDLDALLYELRRI